LSGRIDSTQPSFRAHLDAVIGAFRDQARWCGELGAPFTQQLLRAALADLESDGWLAQRIGHWPCNPVADTLPLRVAGALHALVLMQQAPPLAQQYPPHALTDAGSLWATAVAALQANSALLDDYLAAVPPTNEIGRSTLLYAGFCDLVARHPLPLRLLEIGASAGLNTQWDRYRYRLGDVVRGDVATPVEIQCDWSGALPPDVKIDVRERCGCDLAPIDLTDPAQRQRLRSYVWPDQPQRLGRLDAAIELALRTGPARVDAADAATWLPAQLAQASTGITTVVYHTIVWMYLPHSMRDAVQPALYEAGQRANGVNPLAWLRFEFPAKERPAQLTLTEWPGGLTRTLAQAHPHGAWVEWCA